MAMNYRTMSSGAGRYFQGTGVIELAGEEIARNKCQKAFVIADTEGFRAVQPRLTESLEKAKISYIINDFHSFCTENDIAGYTEKAKEEACDCVVAVGGGKAMDVSKSVAARAGIPVFTVPTCAATCAAYAALSIIYTEEGVQQKTEYHIDEVRAVFVDTAVMADCPERYLAAGMADAMAKSCEYSSMHDGLNYGDIDISKYLSYQLASASDAVLLKCGKQAYIDNRDHVISTALEDALFCTIASTGIESGMGGFPGRTGSRFAIAHGFNEVLRGRYLDTKRWLHGEIVGVGIIAQLHANNRSAEYINQVKDFYTACGLPVTLRDMGLDFNDEQFAVFQSEIAEHSHIDESLRQRVLEAVASVR